MGLYKFKPPSSGRMGILRTLASVRDAALIEYGCMGHMLYGRVFLNQASVWEGCGLYSTHIDETDISMGDTGRLERAVAEIIRCDRPKVVFFLPSAVPAIIGTDLPAICKELQSDYPDVRLLPFGYGGFDIYGYRGVQETLLLLAQALPKDIEKTPVPTFNIIGSCADMFRFHADAGEIIRIMEGAFGMKPLCVLTSDTSVAQIEHMGGAHINLVIRREGKPAAGHLKSRFGTPYYAGRPYGVEGTVRWLKELSKASGLPLNMHFIQHETEKAQRQLLPSMRVFSHAIRSHPDEATLSVGGHADMVKGVVDFAANELSLNKGVCWCDCPEMTSENVPYFTEDQWTWAIQFQKKGLLMASGEVLEWAGCDMELQISNPDTKWRLSPYEPPFVGFHGAVHMTGLWLNALLEQEKD